MVFGKKSEKHSERAKSGTSTQIDGVIAFLEKQLKNYEEEITKYSEEVFAEFRKGIQYNINLTKSSLNYYKQTKDEYDRKGLI